MEVTGNVILISKAALDPVPELKRQLKALTEGLTETNGQYVYQPRAPFLHTFLWLLETHEVSYHLFEPFPSWPPEK